jgi:DoxX-like family
MNILGWVLSGLLAAMYLMVGGSKAFSSYEKTIADPRMGWAKSFSPAQVKAIGAVEVLGALGVILPWATGIAPVLTPIAAVGLALVMVGAMVMHGRRGEKQALPINIVLLLLAVAVAAIRFAQL